MLGLISPHSPFPFLPVQRKRDVREDRKGGFFRAAGSSAGLGPGAGGVKVKVCRVPRWSRVSDGGVVLQVLQV